MKALVTDSNGRKHWADCELIGVCNNGHPCYQLVVPFPIDRDRPPAIDLDGVTQDCHIDMIGMFSDNPRVARYRRLWRNLRVACILMTAFHLFWFSLACIELAAWRYLAMYLVLAAVTAAFGRVCTLVLRRLT